MSVAPIGRIAAAAMLVFALAAPPALATAIPAFRHSVAESAAADPALAAFYRGRDYEPLWTGEGAAPRREALLTALSQADAHGLPSRRYGAEDIAAAFRAARGEAEIGRLEVRVTRAFLDYAREQGAWLATRGQIAAHWAAHHPPARRERPSAMSRAAFVRRFGGVFEHSPWIAERAFDLELGPAHDRATGLHNALCRMFRSAAEAERLGVLTAHPDLAGKLAQAKRLTAESTHEQASAGLDALTDAERDRLSAMNATYVAKHGFPFIIAVRDNTKASIMAAFAARIDNDRATEFATACAQVERIALHRLKDLLP